MTQEVLGIQPLLLPGASGEPAIGPKVLESDGLKPPHVSLSLSGITEILMLQELEKANRLGGYERKNPTQEQILASTQGTALHFLWTLSEIEEQCSLPWPIVKGRPDKAKLRDEVNQLLGDKLSKRLPGYSPKAVRELHSFFVRHVKETGLWPIKPIVTSQRRSSDQETALANRLRGYQKHSGLKLWEKVHGLGKYEQPLTQSILEVFREFCPDVDPNILLSAWQSEKVVKKGELLVNLVNEGALCFRPETGKYQKAWELSEEESFYGTYMELPILWNALANTTVNVRMDKVRLRRGESGPIMEVYDLKTGQEGLSKLEAAVIKLIGASIVGDLRAGKSVFPPQHEPLIVYSDLERGGKIQWGWVEVYEVRLEKKEGSHLTRIEFTAEEGEKYIHQIKALLEAGRRYRLEGIMTQSPRRSRTMDPKRPLTI